jgi:hypothetical protein
LKQITEKYIIIIIIIIIIQFDVDLLFICSYGELLREHEEVLTQWRQQENSENWQEMYQQLEAR